MPSGTSLMVGTFTKSKRRDWETIFWIPWRRTAAGFAKSFDPGHKRVLPGVTSGGIKIIAGKRMSICRMLVVVGVVMIQVSGANAQLGDLGNLIKKKLNKQTAPTNQLP